MAITIPMVPEASNKGIGEKKKTSNHSGCTAGNTPEGPGHSRENLSPLQD